MHAWDVARLPLTSVAPEIAAHVQCPDSHLSDKDPLSEMVDHLVSDHAFAHFRLVSGLFIRAGAGWLVETGNTPGFSRISE